MKILVLPSWYPPEGGKFFTNETNWLQQYGVEADLVTVEQMSLKKIPFFKIFSVFKFTKEPEFGIFTYRLRIPKIPKFYRLNAYIWRQTTFYLAKKYLNENTKPDIMHVHSCMWAGHVASGIKKKFGIPYIITEHRGRFNENNLTKEKDFKAWFNPILKNALQNADAIIPVSALLIKTLEEKARVRLNCYPLPNPVDENLFSPIQLKKKNGKSTIFCNITNFLPYKAIDSLIFSFNDAIKKEPDLGLQLVGNGPGRRKIEDLVTHLNLENKVNFLGQQPSEKVREIINRSDYLVIPSYNEGQPVSVGETLLCGKPVIGTNIISKTDVPEFAGYIVPVGDAQKLTDILIKAHDEKTKFDPHEIREFALERFAKSSVIPAIIKVMNSVIEQDHENHGKSNL